MTIEFPESRATWIREAADDLGMTGALSELPPGEATELRRLIEAHFLEPGDDWWWERLKTGQSYWSGSRGWQPMDPISELCVDAPVWLLPIYDDNGEVFRAPMPNVVDILRWSALDEFAVVADDLAWIVMINHHDAVFGSGERVTAHLVSLQRRPGGQGGAIGSV